MKARGFAFSAYSNAVCGHLVHILVLVIRRARSISGYFRYNPKEGQPLLMLRMADQTGLVPWFGDHGPRLGFGGGGGLICKLPKF